MANPNFSTLLQQAVNEPGTIMKAYSAFHNYSIGNQLLALVQCQLRGIEPGPITTFPKWLDLKRHVKRGEKALTLCMPVTVKRKLHYVCLQGSLVCLSPNGWRGNGLTVDASLGRRPMPERVRD